MRSRGRRTERTAVRPRASAGEPSTVPPAPRRCSVLRTLDAVAKLAQIAAINFRPEGVRLAGGSAPACRGLIPRVREVLSELPQAAVGCRRATLCARGELAALEGLLALGVRAGRVPEAPSHSVAMRPLGTLLRARALSA